ncbi:N-acetyltransferase 8-like [Haliotis rufescens]|uniref:N-acetyltransferase 8-like n=1 Tax=Haliotis rufescens TaxID=6454 RepID=UPI00201F4E26|nr:N-acetyltransferase 8-like [Haliotis rufescens]
MSSGVHIRQWTEKDASGTWEVLKEASFSNLYPSFKIAISRPASIKLASAVALVAGVVLQSFLAVTVSLIIYGCAVYGFSFIGTLYYLYGPTHDDMKNARQNYFRDEDDNFWIAEVNGEIAGTVGIVKKTAGDAERKVAWLRRMAVKRNFRRLGIAKKLVSTAISFCKQRHYDKIELITTEVHQPARNLYTRLGFIMVDYRPYKYLLGLISVWTYEFEYELNDN